MKSLILIIFHLYSARVEGLAAFQLAIAHSRKCKVGNKCCSLSFPLQWIFCFLCLFCPVSAQLLVFYCLYAFETMRNFGRLKAAPRYAEGQGYILVNSD